MLQLFTEYTLEKQQGDYVTGLEDQQYGLYNVLEETKWTPLPEKAEVFHGLQPDAGDVYQSLFPSTLFLSAVCWGPALQPVTQTN